MAISSGGEFSGAAARQPDFLTPYLKHVLGTIGLRDVTFFSVQGTARGAETLEAARAQAEAEIAAHVFAPSEREGLLTA
ncbi:azoreductase [compost metagenome]